MTRSRVKHSTTEPLRKKIWSELNFQLHVYVYSFGIRASHVLAGARGRSLAWAYAARLYNKCQVIIMS